MNAKPMREWACRAAVLSALLLVGVSDVSAQAKDFSIPEGELKVALDAYVAATGQQLVYKVDDVKGLRSKGVQGRATPEQALETLLAGTKLRLRRDPSGAAVIFLNESATGGTDSKAVEAAQVLETVVITGKGFSHLADRNLTSTRIGTNPMELAQSVTTVKRQLIEEQQASSLTDVLRNVAGVTYQPGESGTGYLIRGFVGSVMVNGSLVGSASSRIQRPAVSMDSVEIVRGPESIIGGAQAGYGGVVNVITKVADGQRIRDAQVRFGSQSLKAGAVDLGGSFVDDKSLNYRVVAELERRGPTQVGYLGSKHDFVAPSFAWQNRSTGTGVAFDAAYYDAFSQNSEVVFTNVPPADDLKPRRIGPAEQGNHFKESQYAITFSQQLWPDWSLRWKSNFAESTARSAFSGGRHTARTWPVISVTVTEDTPQESESLSHRAELFGKFNTGPIEHRLLVSFDKFKSQSSDFVIIDKSSYTENLDTGAIVNTSALNGLPFNIPIRGTTSVERGLLVQDQWKWGDFAGQIALREVDTYIARDGRKLSEFNKLLPTVGLVYRATPDLSFYGSRAQTYRSNFGIFFFGGEPLPAESGLQWEVGVKSLLLDKTVAVTASLYQLEQSNVAGPDRSRPGNFGLVLPTVNSKGGEVEASGQISNWSWRLSAAYNHIRDELDRPVFLNRSLAQANAYVRYGFGRGGESEAWVAADAQFVKPAERALPGYPTVLYTPPKHVLLSLSAGYDGPKWFVTGGVRNVFDKRLYQVGRLVIDQPRQFSVSAGVRF